MTPSALLAAFLALDPRDQAEVLGQMQAAIARPSTAQQSGESRHHGALEAYSAYALFREKATGVPFEALHANYQRFSDVASALRPVAKKRGCTLAEVCRESAERYIADAWAKDKSWPVGLWSRDPVKYLAATGGAADKAVEVIRCLEEDILLAIQDGNHDKVAELRLNLELCIAARRRGKR